MSGTPRPARTGARPAIRPDRFRSLRLDRAGLRSALARAGSGLVVSLPAPGGGFQRFTLELSPVMEPALARKHPGIKTFAGRGIDDPTATIRADIGPLGFHASVRSSRGSWYIDPYYRHDQSLYVSYYGRNLDNVHGVFVEREGDALRGPGVRGRARRAARARWSRCGPTGSRCSATRRTPPTSAALPT